MSTTGQQGFTLYELLVTVLVMGIIVGLGVPNLLEFVRNNRMAAAANDLVSALHAARNTAVSERVPVTLCLSLNPLADAPSCDADAVEVATQGGYVVWTNPSADAVIDAGERIILQRADPQQIALFGDSGYVHFGIDGFVADIAGAGDAATEILLCDPRGNTAVSGSLSAARGLRIPATGRPALLVEVDEIATLTATCP